MPDPNGAFTCPRGHKHSEGSAFCTVCGAGPVLSDPSSASDTTPLTMTCLSSAHQAA